MRAVVETAREGDVGYCSVRRLWSFQELRSSVYSLCEYPPHYGFPMLSKYPMQKACGDAEFTRQGRRRKTRIGVAQLDEAAGANEKRFPPSRGRLWPLHPRFVER